MLVLGSIAGDLLLRGRLFRQKHVHADVRNRAAGRVNCHFVDIWQSDDWVVDIFECFDLSV